VATRPDRTYSFKLDNHHGKKDAIFNRKKGSVTKSGFIILSQDSDHPQSAAATIEGLA
jgi:hypothetical protein